MRLKTRKPLRKRCGRPSGLDLLRRVHADVRVEDVRVEVHEDGRAEEDVDPLRDALARLVGQAHAWRAGPFRGCGKLRFSLGEVLQAYTTRQTNQTQS